MLLTFFMVACSPMKAPDCDTATHTDESQPVDSQASDTADCVYPVDPHITCLCEITVVLPEETTSVDILILDISPLDYEARSCAGDVHPSNIIDFESFTHENQFDTSPYEGRTLYVSLSIDGEGVRDHIVYPLGVSDINTVVLD